MEESVINESGVANKEWEDFTGCCNQWINVQENEIKHKMCENKQTNSKVKAELSKFG